MHGLENNSPFIAFNQKLDVKKLEAAKSRKKHNAGTKVKLMSLAGTATGSFTSMYVIAKHQAKRNVFVNPKATLSNMFSIAYSPYSLMGLGIGSILGGLILGSLADKKENRKAKIKEGINQLVGNILVPLTVVGAGLKALDVSKFKMPAKSSSNIVPKTIVSLLGTLVGINIGNRLSTAFNNLLFNEKGGRNVKFTDYCVHTDDIFEIAAFVDSGGKYKSFLGKLLPLGYGLCGFMTGITGQKDNTRSHRHGH